MMIPHVGLSDLARVIPRPTMRTQTVPTDQSRYVLHPGHDRADLVDACEFDDGPKTLEDAASRLGLPAARCKLAYDLNDHTEKICQEMFGQPGLDDPTDDASLWSDQPSLPDLQCCQATLTFDPDSSPAIELGLPGTVRKDFISALSHPRFYASRDSSSLNAVSWPVNRESTIEGPIVLRKFVKRRVCDKGSSPANSSSQRLPTVEGTLYYTYNPNRISDFMAWQAQQQTE